MNLKQLAFIGIGLILSLTAMGCASPAPVQTGPSGPNEPQGPAGQAIKPNYTPGPDEPHIFFMEPLDGDSVSASAYIRFGVARLDLSNKRVYLIIDRACVAPGEALTTDAQHLAFERAQANLSVELSAGPHRLCLQVADNNGAALDGPGMLQVIDITAE